MKCHYCYVARERFPEAPPGNVYDPKLIAKALTQKRLGGKAYLHICAWGETFLDPQIVEVSDLLLREGHYVSLSHNGTIRNVINEFCSFEPRLKQRLHFFVALQWSELKRLVLLDSFAENVRKIKDSSISYSISVTADDLLISEIAMIKEYCLDNFGALCHVLECRDETKPEIPRMTELMTDKHIELWGSFNSLTFDTQQIYWEERRNEFCYMGEVAGFIDFDSGLIWQACGGKKLCNMFDDLSEPIRFCALGRNCQKAHCFLGNILMGGGGVIPEIPYPRFAEQRDRRCQDGSTWYTPKFRKFCSQKAIENMEPYSTDRKVYIDTIMAVVYSNTPIEPEDKIRSIIVKGLTRHKAQSITLHGSNELKNWLAQILRDSKIQVLQEGNNTEAEAVIVTDYDAFPVMRDALYKLGAKKVISVIDIVK